MNQKVMLVNDGSDRIPFVAGGLRDAGYLVVVVPEGNIPSLQRLIREHQPNILMLDEDRVINLEDGNVDLNIVAA